MRYKVLSWLRLSRKNAMPEPEVTHDWYEHHIITLTKHEKFRTKDGGVPLFVI